MAKTALQTLGATRLPALHEGDAVGSEVVGVAVGSVVVGVAVGLKVVGLAVGDIVGDTVGEHVTPQHVPAQSMM